MLVNINRNKYFTIQLSNEAKQPKTWIYKAINIKHIKQTKIKFSIIFRKFKNKTDDITGLKKYFSVPEDIITSAHKEMVFINICEKKP